MTELSKSIKSILYERIASPLYGTLIISWLVINWKIVYLTFVVDQSRVLIGGEAVTKLDYILEYYSNPWFIYFWPFVSTVTILTIGALLANGAFWLQLIFKKWKNNKRLKVEGEEHLSKKKAIKLRNEMANQSAEYSALFEQKEEDLEILKKQVESLSKQNYTLLKKEEEANLDYKATVLYENLIINNRLKSEFKKIVNNIKENKKINIQDVYYFINTEVLTENGQKLTELGTLLYEKESKGKSFVRKEPIEVGSGISTPKKLNKKPEDILFERLKQKKRVKEYLNVCTYINEGESLENIDTDIKYFVKQGFLKYEIRLDDYGITEIGEKVLQKARLEEETE